jgi:hypothetical protein
MPGKANPAPRLGGDRADAHVKRQTDGASSTPTVAKKQPRGRALFKRSGPKNRRKKSGMPLRAGNRFYQPGVGAR